MLVGLLQGSEIDEEVFTSNTIKSAIREMTYRLDKLSDQLTDFSYIENALIIDTDVYEVVARLVKFDDSHCIFTESYSAKSRDYFRNIRHIIDPHLNDDNMIFGEWRFEESA